MWQLRGRQVCTGGAEGAAATECHWGHHLLTVQHYCSPPAHTLWAISKLISSLAFAAGTSFFPQASWKHTENSSWGDLLCHRPALLFLTSFHQLFISLALGLRALPSSYIFIHIPPSFPTQTTLMVEDSYLSCPHTFVFTLPWSHKLLLLP